jgi:hypothetical protein
MKTKKCQCGRPLGAHSEKVNNRMYCFTCLHDSRDRASDRRGSRSYPNTALLAARFETICSLQREYRDEKSVMVVKEY